MRYYLHLGTTSAELLVKHMAAVDKFVEDTNSATKNEQMIFNVKSHALRRLLAKEIAIKYKESANLFTEFKKDSDVFVVKRWLKRNTGASGTSSVRQPNPEESKVAATAGVSVED